MVSCPFFSVYWWCANLLSVSYYHPLYWIVFISVNTGIELAVGVKIAFTSPALLCFCFFTIFLLPPLETDLCKCSK